MLFTIIIHSGLLLETELSVCEPFEFVCIHIMYISSNQRGSVAMIILQEDKDIKSDLGLAGCAYMQSSVASLCPSWSGIFPPWEEAAHTLQAREIGGKCDCKLQLLWRVPLSRRKRGRSLSEIDKPPALLLTVWDEIALPPVARIRGNRKWGEICRGDQREEAGSRCFCGGNRGSAQECAAHAGS